MSYQITHIRLISPFANTPQQIKEVKLKGGAVETVGQAAYFINQGCHYYYLDLNADSKSVTSVHPNFGSPYIKTVLECPNEDGLLQLPTF